MNPGQDGRGLQKTGYISIKQSSKVRSRKMKTWKRKWIAVNQMSDLASGTYAAKLDIYTDRDKAQRAPGDKETVLLDHVTSVRKASSKTHPYAFEIVQTDPVFVLSGESSQESIEWMTTLQRIFCLERPSDNSGFFEVSIKPNIHSTRLNLREKYQLAITTSDVSLKTMEGEFVIKWDLATLKKFYLDKEPNSNQTKVLVIESGPNSTTGEGVLCFVSSQANSILEAIGSSISKAIEIKKQQRQQQQLQALAEGRERTQSFSPSEHNFRAMLDDMRFDGIRERRTSSIVSSTSSSPPVSPLALPQTQTSPPCSPLAKSMDQKSRTLPPLIMPPSQPAVSVDYPTENHPTSDKLIVPGHLQTQSAGRLPKNASVPNMATHSDENGYSFIPEKQISKIRTMSLTSRTSVTSRDSGVVFPDIEGKSPPDVPPRAQAEKRGFSNSFDSAVSNGSFEEGKRKISDAEAPIKEEPTPNPIYNDIDDKQSGDPKSKTADEKQRRHSTGEVKKENEYEDLEKFRSNSSSEKLQTQKSAETPPPLPERLSNTPPALPQRPPKLRLRQLSGDESPLKRTNSGSNPSRHSCIPNIPTFNPGRRCSAIGVEVGQANDPSLSRSSSKDLYASIPDISSIKSSTEAIPISPSEITMTSHGLDAADVCLGIFQPSVEDWTIAAGTPPDKDPIPISAATTTAANVAANEPADTSFTQGIVADQGFLIESNTRGDMSDPGTNRSVSEPPQDQTQCSPQPATADLLGFSDEFLTDTTDNLPVNNLPNFMDMFDQEMAVTKPSDLLKDFDPFEDSSFGNEPFGEQSLFPIPTQSNNIDPNQENIYFDMSANSKDTAPDVDESIYMAAT